jgi:hypothetical protein
MLYLSSNYPHDEKHCELNHISSAIALAVKEYVIIGIKMAVIFSGNINGILGKVIKAGALFAKGSMPPPLPYNLMLAGFSWSTSIPVFKKVIIYFINSVTRHSNLVPAARSKNR